jgi:y4mF family transcriptional regulator
MDTRAETKIQDTRDLGAAIRRRRKTLGLKQQELAQYCGCSVKFLSELENGKPTVRLDKVIRVVKMLGSDFYLVNRDGNAS